MSNYKIVFVTSPAKSVNSITRQLIREKLVACINIIPKISSIYRWKNKIEKSQESLLIMKTNNSNIKKLIKRIRQVHPYEVPEIIFTDITDGNKDYLNWIEDSVR